jgi:hypothetical protein
MRNEHLTVDELDSVARGETPESHVQSHLESCAECRESVREGTFATQYVRPLAADHPDDHVLTALWSNALAPGRKDEVRRHVASCSRCSKLLDRLVRATPLEYDVGSWVLEDAKAWAVASTAPRRATLVVRKSDDPTELRASFESAAGSLRLGELKRGPFRQSEPSMLNDGEHAFRFKPYREGPAACLVLYYVGASRRGETSPVGVTFASGAGPPQHDDVRPGGRTTFVVSPGTSRLEIAFDPAWDIEVRFDA